MNADVWTNLTKKEINQLTIVDNAMVRAIWECPSYTSVPVMFLDLGIKPIKFYIIQRRVMFYHYLLNQDEDSLLFKCFFAQCQEPLPGDWILQVKEDFKILNLKLSDQEIKQQSKASFHKFIKSQVDTFAFEYLMEEKKKQSKCSSIPYNTLKMQDYVLSNDITSIQKKILLQMRTATYPVYANIKFLVDDILCPCCFSHDDTMSHQIECPVINNNIISVSKNAVSLDQIFSQDVGKQIEITRIFDEATKRRKIIVNKKKPK